MVFTSKRAAYALAEKIETLTFVDLALKLASELTSRVLGYIEGNLTTTHTVTGFEHFLGGGSWSSFIISKVLSERDHVMN